MLPQSALYLKLLSEIFPEREAEVAMTFTEQKYSLKKSLFCLTQSSKETPEVLLTQLTSTKLLEQKAILQDWLHCFCPNRTYNAAVRSLKKQKNGNLSTDTIKKLQYYRLAPSRTQLNDLWTKGDTLSIENLIYLLQNLHYFGKELTPFWHIVDGYLQHQAIDVVKATLLLLAQMPDGIHKSWYTISKLCQQEATQLSVLLALQNIRQLPTGLLMTTLQPIVNQYRKLLHTQGAMNALWQEYQLIQAIYKNNGIQISLPSISINKR